MSLAQRELERAFEADFLDVHGFGLLESQPTTGEGVTTNRLPRSPFVDRRLESQRRELEVREQLASFLGLDPGEVL